MDVKLEKLSRELSDDNADNVIRCLNGLGIANVNAANITRYLEELKKDLLAKQQVDLIVFIV